MDSGKVQADLEYLRQKYSLSDADVQEMEGVLRKAAEAGLRFEVVPSIGGGDTIDWTDETLRKLTRVIEAPGGEPKVDVFWGPSNRAERRARKFKRGYQGNNRG